jgi:hypothetical protein
MVSSQVFAQPSKCELSTRHKFKIAKINNGKKRLLKFYKYYKRDSARQMKDYQKRMSKSLDSVYKAEAKQKRLEERLAKKGIVLPKKEFTQADTLSEQLRHWSAVLRDSTVSDSVKQVARDRVKALAILKAKQHPGFQNLMSRYEIEGDTANWNQITQQVPGLDSLSGIFNSDHKQLLALAESGSTEKLEQLAGANGSLSKFTEAKTIANLPGKYAQEYKQYADPGNLKTEAKEKMADKAVDHFAEHQEELLAAQKKVSKLLSKYRSFSNSNDLSDAVKHTSMKGKTFFEHLAIGGNFNIVSTKPFSIDFSPQIGYKFTTRFHVGLGMNYRFTCGDSIKHGNYVSPKSISYKSFANYDVIKSFFAYAEFDRGVIHQGSNDSGKKAWKNNYFIGAGRRILVHSKLYFTITALYNLNDEDKNPIHPRRFQMRFGFQLSELATRKERIHYDPNR